MKEEIIQQVNEKNIQENNVFNQEVEIFNSIDEFLELKHDKGIKEEWGKFDENPEEFFSDENLGKMSKFRSVFLFAT